MTVINATWPEWKKTFARQVAPALEAVHGDLTRIAEILRGTWAAPDGRTYTVHTESPTDTSRYAADSTFSMEGWRVHFVTVRQRLNGFLANNRAALEAWEPGAITAIEGLHASMGNIGPVFNSVVDNYKDADGNVVSTEVTQADRNTLAAAIEAELQ